MFAHLIILYELSANLHIKCMHSVGIIKNSWRNSNTSPAYVVSILNSGNILYVCDSFKPNFSINNVTPPSQMTPITLNSSVCAIKLSE